MHEKNGGEIVAETRQMNANTASRTSVLVSSPYNMYPNAAKAAHTVVSEPNAIEEARPKSSGACIFCEMGSATTCTANRKTVDAKKLGNVLRLAAGSDGSSV